MTDYDVIVVGGGAAGMIAAGAAAENGLSVLVAEKMPRPARKILVTGKGRCNLTNNCDVNTLIKNTKTNTRFLYSAYSGFTPQDTMALFESLDVPLITQRGNRVYPKSERAMDIADAMVRFVTKNGGRIAPIQVDAIIIKNGKLQGVKSTDGESFFAPQVIVATGGVSYPSTGSTGDGYKLARQVGHTVSDLRPSLIPIVTSEPWAKDLMGLSLKNVCLTLKQKGKAKPVFSQQGEMLFTHFGISGPLVLSASAYMKNTATDYSVTIDMKPALTVEQVDKRIIADFKKYNNRDFINALDDLLPRAMIPIVAELSGIPFESKVNQITKNQRLVLVELLKAVPMTPISLRPIEEAVVTSGGVVVKDIDPKTMESKLVKGLYFAGEVLDLDAYTGGFNLQIAFSTGWAAGKAVEKGKGE